MSRKGSWMPPTERFERLPQQVDTATGIRSQTTFANTDWLLPALRDFEYVVESGWLGHVPFMFALMELHEPRRYVELGTHRGASFFAACQAVRDSGLHTECIAIDHWQGDNHAGQYSEDVYTNFRQTAENFGPGVRFRTLASTAAPSSVASRPVSSEWMAPRRSGTPATATT